MYFLHLAIADRIKRITVLKVCKICLRSHDGKSVNRGAVQYVRARIMDYYIYRVPRNHSNKPRRTLMRLLTATTGRKAKIAIIQPYQ